MATTYSAASNLVTAPVFLRLLFFLFTAYGFLWSSEVSPSMTPSRRFVAKLIHHDSIFSPYYNPDHSIYDLAELARTSSTARFGFLSSRARNSSFESLMADYQAEVLPELSGSLFMARISFGEPPVPQLLAVDTASTLLWIQCLPCSKCLYQLEPIFDPAKSSTYRNIPCNFPECTDFPIHHCDRLNNCMFSVIYMDGTNSHGFLSLEQVTIGTSDDGLTSIPRMIFGCANWNFEGKPKKGRKGQISGVLGLGPGSESFVHKVGNKFSYCVGNMDDLSYPFNQLALGEAARLEGYSTPMELGSEGYRVTLEGISVGQKRLDVTRETFQGGGVMVDSGSTYTYLTTEGYRALKDEVARLMDGLMESLPDKRYGQLELCYKGNVRRDLKGFPVTTFHMAGGADLVVDIDGMFSQVDRNAFCMAVAEAGENEGLSIIGILAQQYYNVGYDLDQKRIYFQRVDCEVLVS